MWPVRFGMKNDVNIAWPYFPKCITYELLQEAARSTYGEPFRYKLSVTYGPEAIVFEKKRTGYNVALFTDFP